MQTHSLSISTLLARKVGYTRSPATQGVCLLDVEWSLVFSFSAGSAFQSFRTRKRRCGAFRSNVREFAVRTESATTLLTELKARAWPL
jgi:hypothetical protein